MKLLSVITHYNIKAVVPSLVSLFFLLGQKRDNTAQGHDYSVYNCLAVELLLELLL